MNRDRNVEQLPASAQHLLQVYTSRMGTALGSELESCYLYGSAVRGEYLNGRSNLNLLLVVRELTGERLRALAGVLAAWKKEQVVTLVLSTQEFAQWAAQFPVEFSELADYRVLFAGRETFPALRPDSAGVAKALLRGAHETLIRVRQRYLEGEASTESATILMALSATAVGAFARTLLRLWDLPPQASTEASLQTMCERLGLDPAPMAEGWAIRCGRLGPGQLEIPRMFDRYVGSLTDWVTKLSDEALLAGHSKSGTAAPIAPAIPGLQP